MRRSREWVRLVIAVTLVSCGGGDAGEGEEAAVDESQPAASETAPAAPGAEQSTTAPVSVEDIDRWQRGLAAELQAVQEAATRYRSAKTADDSLNAVSAMTDMSTLGAGATAAGVSPDRYQFIRTALSTATGYLAPLEQEMNVSQMPAAMLQDMEKNRAESLAQMSNEVPSNVVEALKPRAAELRKQDLTLTVERLKAMGA